MVRAAGAARDRPVQGGEHGRQHDRPTARPGTRRSAGRRRGWTTWSTCRPPAWRHCCWRWPAPPGSVVRRARRCGTPGDTVPRTPAGRRRRWPARSACGLAGPRVYGAVRVDDGWMGDGRAEAGADDIGRALRLYRRACNARHRHDAGGLFHAMTRSQSRRSNPDGKSWYPATPHADLRSRGKGTATLRTAARPSARPWPRCSPSPPATWGRTITVPRWPCPPRSAPPPTARRRHGRRSAGGARSARRSWTG